MNLSNRDIGLGPGMWTSTSSAALPLGTRGVDKFGNVYRYAQAGAVATIAGKVYQSAAPIVGHQAIAVHTAGAATGASSISVTCASCAAAGFYNDGYLIVASGAGEGYKYSIASHPAVSTGAAGIFTFYAPEETVQVAITSTSTVTLAPSKYKNILIVPATTATGLVVGVATYVIAATEYGWIQTWGQCAVHSNDASALGQWVNGIAASCGRVAGMSSPAVTACYIVGQFVGHMMQTGVAGQWVIVDLRISP